MASSEPGDGAGPSKNDIPRGLINRSGNSSGRGGRLPSVKGVRDLTLGGVQRKIFTPNLAAVKKPKAKEEVKPNVAEASPSLQSNGKGRGRSDRGKDGRGRGRGRGQREDRTIQLQSEFAHGPMGGSRSSGWGRTAGGGGGGGGGGGSKDTSDAVTMKAIRRNEDTEEEKKMLDNLLRDDFISDLSSGDPLMAPINLPLYANLSKIKLEEKVEVKEELMETDQPDPGPLPTPTLPQSIHSTKPEHLTQPSPKTVKDILDLHPKSEQGEFLLLQFPDTLPGLPTFDADDDKSKDTTTKDKKEGQINMCQLKDCNEGYMGKIRVRKSGKAELVLGDNVMDIMPGIPTNFHQELVSIHTDDSPGQLVVLGPVEHKLLLMPNYKHLLENT